VIDLPAPLSPRDCDLRGLEWMPLFGYRLKGSDTWRSASLEARGVMIPLWWTAWSEAPAGSLPDDDAFMASACGITDMRIWKRLREVVLRGFVMCSDGRFYHPVLCVEAKRTWEKRVKARTKKAAQREEFMQRCSSAATAPLQPCSSAATGLLQDCIAEVNNNSDLASTVPGDVPDDRTGQDRTEEREEEDKGSPSAPCGEIATPQEELLPSATVHRIRVLDDVPQAVVMWNEMAAAHGLPKVQSVTETRRRLLRARLKEAGGLDGWKHCLEVIAGTPFLLGLEGSRSWRADFDFVVKAGSFTKIMEGGFPCGPGKPAAMSSPEAFDEAFRMMKERGISI
jgi:hypothetical protein